MPGSWVSVRVEGANRLAHELGALGVDVEDLKDAFAELAAKGARIAARNAPVLTGTLQADIRGNRAKNKAVVTAGRARVPYAGPINFGWPARNIEPAGFMQQVDVQLGPFAPLLLQRTIDDLIRKRALG